MSDLMIRNLAAACAPRIAQAVERGVMDIVRAELPSVIEAVLREQYSGETLQLYIPKKSVTARRDRDNAIRALYNGQNARDLAEKFGLSERSVFRIAQGSR